MEFEFDKEMDSLLRQTAQDESAFATDNRKSGIQNPKSFHLDADEISLFAENALPEKLKSSYAKHFADCDRCRKILANVISSDSAAQIETARAPQTAKIAAGAPWYRRLFGVPNLAYAAGALVVVFAGLIALTFLHNAPQQTAEVSQARDVPVNTRVAASSDGDTKIIEAPASNSVSASVKSNSAANSAPANRSNGGAMSNGAKPNASPVSGAASSRQNAASRESAKTENQQGNELGFAPKNTAESPASVEEKKNQTSNDEIVRVQENDSAQSDAASSRNTTPTVAATRSAVGQMQAKNARKTEAENSETKQIGGKTFRRDGGIWYDSIYKGQSTTNIARASEDFSKLDANLRSIAGSLSGTIVVVWNGKAYRIQ